jgi:hypothetical protein
MIVNFLSEAIEKEMTSFLFFIMNFHTLIVIYQLIALLSIHSYNNVTVF